MEDDGATGARSRDRPYRGGGPCSGCSTPTAGRWASLKAFVWLIIIIFLLGYLPDRAYYFTVGRTVDLGVLVWSPINLCPPTNETLPCPAPVGALVPWQPSPPELQPARSRGPTARSSRSGRRSCTSAARDGTTAQSTVYVAKTVGTGNFDKWAEGPPLPEPRADASVAYVAGSIYVIGGTRRGRRADRRRSSSSAPTARPARSASGRRPTTWRCPKPRSGPAIGDHAGRAAADRRAQRRRAGGDHVEDEAQRPGRPRRVVGGAAARSPRRPTRPRSSSATSCGCTAGSDANGPVGTVQRGEFGLEAAERACPRTRTKAS